MTAVLCLVTSQAASTFDPESTESIGKFLKSLAPRSEAEVEKILQRLTADDFVSRQKASRQLADAVVTMRPFLEEKLKKTRDPELRRGISRALARTKNADPTDSIWAAARAVIDHGHEGLAADLASVLPATRRLAAHEEIIAAACTSYTDDDRAKLVELLRSESAWSRTAAARILRSQGGDVSKLLRPLIDDKDPRVQLVAAEALADAIDPACIDALSKLAANRSFYIRWRAIETLRQIVPEAAKLDPIATPEPLAGRFVPPDTWEKPSPPNPIVLLSNGRELKTWNRARNHHLDDFRPTPHKDFVRFNSTASTVWSPPHRFARFRLRLEWRFPGESYSDSGVSLGRFSKRDTPKSFDEWSTDAGVEIQIKPLTSGKFVSQGMPMMVRGKSLEKGAQSRTFYPSNERSGWNQMEIEEYDGTIRVFVNGLLQNEATRCAFELSDIGLRSEGHPIDFRNVTIEPLPGGIASPAAKLEEGAGDE